MLRTRRPAIEPLLAQIAAVGEGAPPLSQKLALAAAIRGGGADGSQRLDEFLITEHERLRGGLQAAELVQGELRQLLERLSAPPCHPAVFLGAVMARGHQEAAVIFGSARRIVEVAPEVSLAGLRCGDDVLLSNELNVIVGTLSDVPFFRGGETAAFERSLADGRIVLRTRDEEVVVSAAEAVREAELRPGDALRWDRPSLMAFERIERARGEDLLLGVQEAPQESFEDVGGLDDAVATIKRLIDLHVLHPELGRLYELDPKGSCLLTGPPGTGKTLLARATANYVGRQSAAARSHFIPIAPSQLHSEWYSKTEQNYSRLFAVARETAEREPEIPVVLFIDEVDAVASQRGRSLTHTDDRILNTILSELDGFRRRKGVLVMAATNRAEALDVGILRPGRLGDEVIEVGRPNRAGARSVFEKHLSPRIPYACADADPGAARDEMIECALARIFAGDGSSDVATLSFRDGKQQTIAARDLVSGAVIANVVRGAKQQALVREFEGAGRGLTKDDLLDAVEKELATAANQLAPHNVRDHLSGLPHDADVVRVQPIPRRVRRAHRYLSLAWAGGEAR